MTPAALTVRGDARRLKQMLVNLLSNAIKFTPAGSMVGLEVQANPPAESVSLTVWDKGIGIAQADLARLFQPFVQLESSLARQYEGSGLGLSLVRSMAELHGGSIHVESEIGEGSRFTIVLPWIDRETELVHLATSDAGRANPVPAVEGPVAKVLLVDDSELIIETFPAIWKARDTTSPPSAAPWNCWKWRRSCTPT